MGWIRALKHVRRYFHNTPGELINKWVTRFFHEQESKKQAVFLKYSQGTFTKEEFIALLQTDDAKRLITEEEQADYINRFESIDEPEMDMVLSKVFPKQFTLKFCIESLNGKQKDDFTPSEWNDVYATAIRYFSRERRGNLTELLDEFWNDDVYQSYLADGHTDEEIFNKFISTCSYYTVHPLYCDLEMHGGDGYYKLLDLSHYVKLLSRRTGAIASELKSKAREVKAIEAKGIDLQLPSVNGEFREQLDGGDNIYGTLKFPLPPHQETEVYPCPYCPNRKFKSQEMMKRHLRLKHGAHE